MRKETLSEFEFEFVARFVTLVTKTPDLEKTETDVNFYTVFGKNRKLWKKRVDSISRELIICFQKR